MLGRGAFGTVLKAFDEMLHRVVAIKLMSVEMAATSPARKRFLREARASAAIRHENIVSIHSVDEQPVPHLVMEYIPGQTLQQRLDVQGPLDTLEVLRLGQQIASGLAAAHARGLICYSTQISDLSPLAGMDLEELQCGCSLVSDLSPLKGMKLQRLLCDSTLVSDLAPIQGMPLTELTCEDSRIVDLAIIKDMPLKHLRCDFVPERDSALLRGIKTLELINLQPVVEFWMLVDKAKP